jgi:HEPN domain-containing protein
LSTVPEPLGEVESLLAAAKRDSLEFDLLAAQPEAPTEVMFFLAQQSIKKIIKAVLAHRKVAYRKTHDLVELSALLGDDSLRAVLPEDLMIRLGPYAVEMRYVNAASPRVSVDEVKRAVAGLPAWAQRMVTRSKL